MEEEKKYLKRGQRIPGTNKYRQFCGICGIAIRVREELKDSAFTTCNDCFYMKFEQYPP